MATVIMKNSFEGSDAIVPPRHADESGFQYCLYKPGNFEVAFADTYAELLEVLIPNYTHMDEDEQILSRIRLATSAAVRIQTEVLLTPEYEELIDAGLVSQEELSVLNTPRAIQSPRADWWKCKIPLVVVETDYEPFTETPRPASALSDGTAVSPNLFWIRPVEEEDFLISMNEVGYITVMTNNDIE